MTYLQDRNTIQYYRDSIMESLSEIDESRYKVGLIKRSDLNRIINLTEAYSVMCNIRCVFLCESEMFVKSVERLVKEYKYRIKTLNEGFENPFDDDDIIDIDTRYEDQCDVEPEGSVKIKKIGLWNDNTNSKVNYMDGKIVSGQFFAPNLTCILKQLGSSRSISIQREIYMEFLSDMHLITGVILIVIWILMQTMSI